VSRDQTGRAAALVCVLFCVVAHGGQLYFQEPSIQSIDRHFFVAPQSVPRGLFELIQWPSNPGSDSGDVSVGWDAGLYTGFMPPLPLNHSQRGVSNTIVGSTVVQAVGHTVGILIDSASLTTPGTGPGTLFPIVAQYDFPAARQFRPFAEPGKLLVYAMQAQVPYANGEGTCGNAGSACAYATLYFDIEDVTTGLMFWYGATLYDTRGTPNGIGYVGETVMYDGSTQQAIIGGVVNLSAAEGAMFTTALTTSGSFQSQTWQGYRPFQFAVSAGNLRNAIARVAADFPQQYGGLSSNPADYRVLHFNFNPEVAYFGGHAAIGVSFNNIRISVQDGRDCHNTYNGVSDVTGLTNGDARFLCHDQKWYGCGYPGTAGWSIRATDGEKVGSHTCDIAAAAWRARRPQGFR